MLNAIQSCQSWIQRRHRDLPVVAASSPAPAPAAPAEGSYGITVEMVVENPQDTTTGTTVVCNVTECNLSGEDAVYMLIAISRHLKHKRSYHCAQDPSEVMVHQYYEEECVICPCCNPTFFEKALQILVYIHNSEGGTYPPARVLPDGSPGGFMGVLAWDWRTMDTVDMLEEVLPRKTLNIQHYEETGFLTDTSGMGWELPQVYEYRMVPKVAQDWAPVAGDGENMGTCSICLSDVTSDHVKTPCGHHFHGKCLGLWQQRQQVCPMCRVELA